MATTGYIYIFTVDHTNAYIKNPRSSQFEPLELADASVNSCCCFFRRRSSNRGRLVKIGYTGKSPQIRLNEWKSKCKHHSFELLAPKRDRHSAVMAKGPPALKTNKSPALKTKTPPYDYSKSGWPTKDPKTVEALIHASLRKKYGRGHLECHGCNGKHIEWFLLPSDEHLVKVYKEIEKHLR